MASKIQQDSSVNERRLRPIYGKLDIQSGLGLMVMYTVVLACEMGAFV